MVESSGKERLNKMLGHYFVMTVDVDGWSSLLRFYSVDHNPLKVDSQVSVEDGILRLLHLFDNHEIKATFFVPGRVAQNHAWVMKKIFESGHEVACHGLAHEKNECLLSKTSQRRSIKEATEIVEEKTGSRPRGFRAPCLTVNKTTLEILDEYEYKYDSSVVPTYIPGYYGNLFAPAKPYHPSHLLIEKKGSFKLLEIPISVNPIIPLPLSAAWMRNLGSDWVKFGVKMNFVLGNPIIFYVHPRDVVSLPKIKGIPWHLYRNVGDPAVRMLDEIIGYAKRLGAKFIQAIDLANSALKGNEG